MYKAVVPIVLNMRSSDLAEAIEEARQLVEQLAVLPSIHGYSTGHVEVYDIDGNRLYPGTACIRCGDDEPEEQYYFSLNGLCNYCNHIIGKEIP